MKRYFKLLYTYLKPQWPRVTLLGFLLGGSIALQIISPQIVRFFIDSAILGESSRTLILVALLFIGVAVVEKVFSVFATYVSQKVGWSSTNALRSDLVSHCLNLDMSFHKLYRPGEIIERIEGDITAMFEFFSKFVIMILNNLVLLLGILIVLYLEDWRIGIALTIFVIIAAFSLFRIQSIATPYRVRVREIASDFFGFLGEQISSTEDIRSNGAVKNVMYRFHKALHNWLPATFKANIMYYVMMASTLSIIGLGNALSIGIGGYLWTKGVITIGTVYLIFNYTGLINRPLEQIRNQLSDLQKAGACIIRIEELFKIQAKLKDGDGPILATGSLPVEVDKVFFEYESGVPVLREVSVKVEPGKVLGVLGRTGSGKTTLARLMARLYDPTTGEIRLGGRPIHSVPLHNLRQSIAYVTQDVQLFNATIRDNLTFFNPEISDTLIVETLENIGMGEWYASLPDGLDTIIESDGGGLSAGEAQLLTFVRVFLKNPGLVILDEASSRLDPLTERLIEGAITKLLEGRTAIIIAHRLQTVERADQILIMEQGQVLEYGDRVKLANRSDSHFCHLLKAGLEEVLA